MHQTFASPHRRPANTWPSPVRGIAVFSALMAIAILGWYLFSNRHVQLSENGYELSKALYAACNLADPARLAAFESTLPRYPLTPEERSKMEPILDLAKAGQWQDAAVRARALLESQATP
ncbi:MAG: hypothetical protein ACO1RT_07840 [Planctomycetaceae bacterium]